MGRQASGREIESSVVSPTSTENPTLQQIYKKVNSWSKHSRGRWPLSRALLGALAQGLPWNLLGVAPRSDAEYVEANHDVSND